VPDPDAAGDAAPDAEELGEVLGRLSGAELDRGERRRLVTRLARLLAQRLRTTGTVAVTSGRWLGDLFIETAPHIPVRDVETLRAHHHGLTGEALADALIRNAANASTAVGAATGTFVAAQWIVAPVLVAIPLEILVETLAVAAIELKLIAELHAVYGVPVDGTASRRAIALTGAWAHRRGVDPWRPWAISSAVIAGSRAAVSRRMLGRFGRNLGGLAPLMIGALYGARSNRRQTQQLGAAVRRDLQVWRAGGRPAG
jgi:hypothetical protein